jgi:hypothetical protein
MLEKRQLMSVLGVCARERKIEPKSRNKKRRAEQNKCFEFTVVKFVFLR